MTYASYASIIADAPPKHSMSKLLKLANEIATREGVDPALVCAVVEQESAWSPWAVRFEPAFYERYTKPMHLSDTEEYTRAISFGLMQLMGESAREAGFTGKYLSELCDPTVGLTWGCRWLQRKLARANGDVTKGLLAWNGGGNPLYPSEVLARISHYP